MKLKKVLTSIVAFIIVFCIAMAQTASYAAEGSLYVSLRKPDLRPTTNTGYKIADKTIWDFKAYTDMAGTSTIDKNLYCVKAGVGFTLTEESNIREYNQSFNLKTQKSEIEKLTTDNYSNIAGEYYYQILWIVDNMYVPGETTDAEKAALLSNAGIDYKAEDSEYALFPMTDDDIEVVQQMAIWYYTNYDDPNYHKTPEELYNGLKFTTDGTYYDNLSTYHQSTTEEGRIRAEQAKMLYEYLITSAETNAGLYDQTTNEVSSPISVNTTTLNIKQDGSNYLAGPINITKNNQLPYTIDIKVTDQESKDITDQAKFVTADGKEVTNFVGQEFYVQVPTTVASTVNVSINVGYKTTDAILWVSGTSNVEQPLIEVTKMPHEVTVDLTVTPDDKIFDLALRKFITAISNDNVFENGEYVTSDGTASGTYTREPQVSYVNGAIKYTHTKEPIKVENGDYIEYTLRIYNEGQIDGYAEEITDYILKNQGLQFVPDHETNLNYGWTMYDASGAETTDITKAVKIKTDYLSKAKGEQAAGSDSVNANLLKAFNPEAGISDTNPDHRDLKIVFKVTEPNSSKNTLVNIAEISDDYNEEGVDDIDSVPGSDSKGYPDNGYNTENHEDDIDYEPVILKEFDLSLKKFIAAVSHDSTIEEGEYLTDTGNSDGAYTRAPVVTSIEDKKVVYNEDSKEAYPVQNGDYVLYTLRIYNEGEIDGYASLIRDSIPEGLEFVITDTTYNGIWTLSDDLQSVTTNYLAKGQGAELDSVQGEAAYTANLLKALQTDENGDGTVSTTDPLNPDYRDVQVLFKVVEPDTSNRILTNQAQIADDTDENGDPIDDVDSIPDEWNEGEDDQDIERVKLQCLDLSLRKFITSVDGTEVAESREPAEDVTNLADGTDTTATYNHTKNPVSVNRGSNVVYTIRVYNEGDVDGYASKITDHLPPYLKLTENSQINSDYNWVASEDGRTITTDYLDGYILKAFDGEKLYYQDIQIECTVSDDAVTKENITNIAEISEYKDSQKVVINMDRDSISDSLTNESTTDNLPSDEDLPTYKDDEIASGATYIPGQEDDDDFEKVFVEEFDLSLIKYVSQVVVIEDGVQKITETGNNGSDSDMIPKVEIDRKKINSTVVKFVYTIQITNEGDIPGYAKQITDYIPEGLKFVAEDNPLWIDNGDGSISTRALENTLLNPGDSAPVTVTFTWINDPDNLGLKTNTAEISEDYNDKGVPDRDSAPNNRVPGEDDIDTADVLLSIGTGMAKTYIVLAGAVLIVLASGIVIIRKFVL